MKLSAIVRGVIGGALLMLTVVGALVVPSLLARPGVFPEVPVAVPPEYGLSVVRAAAASSPHDRQMTASASAPPREHRRVALARPARTVVVAAPAPRPVSRPPAAPAPTPAAPPAAPAPAPAPAPSPQPAPAPEPAPAPKPPEREILVAEPEPAAPPQGKPVVDESPAPEPAKNEGEKKGHEKNEPQRNGHEHDDDQRGGPMQDRGPRD